MEFSIRHSLPGRIRVGYNSRQVFPRQAALAQHLISLQDGVSQVHLNTRTASFLIYYQPAVHSVKSISSLFAALDSKYLDDGEILKTVPEPVRQSGLMEVLINATLRHYLKRLLPVPILTGLRFFNITPRILKGVRSLLRGRVSHTDVLDATALTAALASGNRGTADNINFLLKMGETIEDFTKKKSFANLSSTLLSGQEPVHVLAGNEENTVPLYLVRQGDTVVVRTGGLIPADGAVLSGEALVNQAVITGEPLAVEKRGGSTVYAGTVVQEGELIIQVRAVGSQTKVQNILSQIDSSQQLKISSQIRSEHLADKLVRYNFLLAFLTFAVTRNPAKTLSTLMVDYSCAMKLAAPVAVLSAMKEAAENGILVKGGKFLEEAAKADTVVFDKTGTLTDAAPRLSRIIPLGDRSESDLLKTAACLEEHFAHPVARSLVEAAEQRGLSHPEEHAKVEYVVAHGIATTLSGSRVLIGSRHFIFEDAHIPVPDDFEEIQAEALRNGESLLLLAEDNRLTGIFAVTDPVRPDAPGILRELRATGVENCFMITGDDEGAASSVAAAAGLDGYKSRALPEDKVSCIQRMQQEGRTVIMVGDGINDAPALSAADAGIAMGKAAAIAGETADIVLSHDNSLQDLVKTRVIGQSLMRRIDRVNFGIIGVNSLLIALGLFGLVSSSVAALLHNSSTVLFCAAASRPFLREKQ